MRHVVCLEWCVMWLSSCLMQGGCFISLLLYCPIWIFIFFFNIKSAALLSGSFKKKVRILMPFFRHCSFLQKIPNFSCMVPEHCTSHRCALLFLSIRTNTHVVQNRRQHTGWPLTADLEPGCWIPSRVHWMFMVQGKTLADGILLLSDKLWLRLSIDLCFIKQWLRLIDVSQQHQILQLFYSPRAFRCDFLYLSFLFI